MSDALSDIAKDERRSEAYIKYLSILERYLQQPTEETKTEIIAAAQETDGIRGGYWGGKTNLQSDIENRLTALLQQDSQAWGELLGSLSSEAWRPWFVRLKKLSPFAEKLVIHVDYGRGFVTFKGDIEGFLGKLIAKTKGWKTYDCDKYLVLIDAPDQSSAEVIWTGCGIIGVNGPRSCQ